MSYVPKAGQSITKSAKSSISYDSTGPTGSLPRSKEGRGSLRLKTVLTVPKFQSVPVIIDGRDVTPVMLNPYLYEAGKERQLSILDNLTKEGFMLHHHSSINRADSQKLQANVLMQKQEMDTATFTRRSVVTSAYFGEDIVLPSVNFAVSKSETSGSISVLDAESIDETKIEIPIPEHISLILSETETFFLLDLPSSTVMKQSEDANAVEEDNKLYDFLTKGKGRNRKVISVGIQTVPVLKKARDTITKKRRYKHCSTYVSAWEMFDTYRDLDKKSSDEETDEMVELSDEELGTLHADSHKLNDEASLESYRMSAEDKQLNKIVKSKAFLDALIVIERILGNNCYNIQQKRYKGLLEPDVFRENIQYKYRLELLWTYANDDTEGRCVTGVAFNSFNEDLVGVAYGKYFYTDRNASGLVMIWNIKNPQQPERQYNFETPVTSLAFSTVNPNLLAIGFYNGHLKIIDVSKREILAIREDVTFFEPVWSMLWFQQGEDEDLMVSFGDGRVCRYQITTARDLKRTQIMLTAAAEGKLKGIKYLKKCEGQIISIMGYDQARCLAMHPCDPFTYFVGTSEGVVHRCSTNYYNEHMDLFKAHDGAIHTIRFSPFANKLYYTCGDDFRARLWVDGNYSLL